MRNALLAALVTLAACVDTSGPSPPAVVAAVAEPVGSIVRLRVELDRPGPITVEYGGGDVPELVVASDEERDHHEVLLTRLRPGARYRYTVRVAEAHHTGDVDAPVLPGDLADLRLEVTGAPTLPLVLLEVNQGASGFRGAVMVDATGSVVWHHRTTGALTGVARRASGDFVFVDLGVGLVVVSPTGDVVAQLASEPGRVIHHDVVEVAGGTLLFLTTDERAFEGRTIVGDAVWAWNPESGAVDLVWSAFDHLSPASDRGARSRDTDWLHANSLTVGPRGNLVVSLNFLNQVLSIRPDDAGLEWRLGGPGATVPVADDAAFSGQHTATELPGGRVFLFDNGIERIQAPQNNDVRGAAHTERRVLAQGLIGAVTPAAGFDLTNEFAFGQ